MSLSAESFRRGILYCCIHFVYWKNLDQSGGVSKVSVESFLSLIAEIFRRGILHCCIISGTEKVWIGGGEYQEFRSKSLCLTVRNFFVGESFTVALI